MRISRDSDSRRADGARRRDFRAGRDEPETARPRPARKDTRRWCRGRVGREHVAQRVPLGYHTRTIRVSDPAADGGYRQETTRIPTAWTVRCGECGRQDLPDHVRAKVDPDLARRLELAARWCTEGHLYDTVERSHGRHRWTIRACVMCGTPG